MNSYILILMADLFLTLTFVFQKKYQKMAGAAAKAGLWYNFLMGLASACMLLVINKFKIEITLFSFFMAFTFSAIIMIYICMGFKIMEKGNMSTYTLFLMSGGMAIPYVWGVMFLNEELTIFRTLGLIAIIISIAMTGSGIRKTDKDQVLMCIAVFFLNGIASIVSKLHQISPASELVEATDFAFLVMILKAAICILILTIGGKRISTQKEQLILSKIVFLIAALAGVADGITYMLQLIGAVDIPATVLYPFLTGGSVIFTTLAGVGLYKEKLSRKQWAGMAICFLGTLLFL